MKQSFASLHLHIVFSTKNRQQMIIAEFRERLYEYIGGILANQDRWTTDFTDNTDEYEFVYPRHP